MAYTISVEVLLSNLEIGDAYTVNFDVGSVSSSQPSSVLPQSINFYAYKKTQSVSVIVTKPEEEIVILNAVSTNDRTNITDTTSVFVKCEHEPICRLITPTPTKTTIKTTPTPTPTQTLTQSLTPTPTQIPLCVKAASITTGKQVQGINEISERGIFKIDINDFAIQGSIFRNSILKFNNINFGKILVNIEWPIKPDMLPTNRLLNQNIDLPTDITDSSPVYEIWTFPGGPNSQDPTAGTAIQQIKGQITGLNITRNGNIISYNINGRIILDETGSGLELLNSTLTIDVDESYAENIGIVDQYSVYMRNLGFNMDDGLFIKDINFVVFQESTSTDIEGILFCTTPTPTHTPTITGTPTLTPTPTPSAPSTVPEHNFVFLVDNIVDNDSVGSRASMILWFYLQNHSAKENFKLYDSLLFSTIYLSLDWLNKPVGWPNNSIPLENFGLEEATSAKLSFVKDFNDGTTTSINVAISDILSFNVFSTGSLVTYTITSRIISSIDVSLINRVIETVINMDISKGDILETPESNRTNYRIMNKNLVDDSQNDFLTSIRINGQRLPLYAPTDFVLSLPEGIDCDFLNPYKLQWAAPFTVKNISTYYLDTIYQNDTTYSAKYYPNTESVCFNPKSKYDIDRSYSLTNSAVADLPELSVGTIVTYRVKVKTSDTGEYDTGSFEVSSNTISLICSSTDGDAGFWELYTGSLLPSVPSPPLTPTPTRLPTTPTPTPSPTQIPIVNTIDIGSLDTLLFEYQKCVDIGITDGAEDCAMGEAMFILDESWDSMDRDTFSWIFNDIGITKTSLSSIGFYFPAASFANYLGPTTLPNWIDPSTEQPYWTDYYYYQYIINDTQIETTIPKKYDLNFGIPPHLIGQFNLGSYPYIVGKITNLPLGSKIDFTIGTISYPGITQNVAKRFGVPQIGKKLLNSKVTGSPITFSFQL